MQPIPTASPSPRASAKLNADRAARLLGNRAKKTPKKTPKRIPTDVRLTRSTAHQALARLLSISLSGSGGREATVMSDPDSRRALRRHHRDRVIAHARTVTRRWHNSWESAWNDPLTSPSHDHADAQAARIADYLKVCSCQNHGCGNPRRGDPYGYGGRTRQEEFAEQELREEATELGLRYF